MKNKYVFDIECDGLKPTKIHCLSCLDLSSNKIKSTSDYGHMRKFFSSAHTLIGHNIQRFDIPVVERLLKIKVSSTLIDTLALSWYLYDDRIKHGLEEWGEDLGIKKPEIKDWENLSLEEYVFRCESDVRINTELWLKQERDLHNLYETEAAANKLLAYLRFKMDCAREQEEVGWRLDKDRCSRVLSSLVEEKKEKESALAKAMPKVPIKKTKKRPAKPYNKDGSVSKAYQSWLDLCKELGVEPDSTDELEYVKEYKEPNPTSHIQIKSWLYGMGWQPKTFVYKRHPTTLEIKAIPQIQQDKTLGPGLCKSVLFLAGKEPAIEHMQGLSIINHRIPILNGFLENCVDGRIKAEVGGLTNTLRFKHRVLVNLPGVQNPYGEDIRGCLISGEGKVLCGSDQSGLEDRLKQHYLYKFDPEYVEEMSTDDYDPHLALALSAGAITEEQADKYKSGEDKSIKDLRHTYKQGNYAAQYGARPKRIALTLGCTRQLAEKIYDSYWKKNWAINAVADEVYTKVCLGKLWLYNPISGFWYSLRCEKDKFSTLVQGSGVYCFDSWVREVRKKRKITAQFHDEIVIEIDEGDEDKVLEELNEAERVVNEKLNLNRKLEIDVQFGKSYSEIH